MGYKEIVLGIVALIIVFVSGYTLYSFGKSTNQMEVDQQIIAQQEAADKKEKEYQANAAKTQEDYQASVDAIREYYNQHPAIRVFNSCPSASGVPSTNGSSETTDAANTGLYVTPYSPEDSEIVAARLNNLQQLLIKNGVTVE